MMTNFKALPAFGQALKKRQACLGTIVVGLLIHSIFQNLVLIVPTGLLDRFQNNNHYYFSDSPTTTTGSDSSASTKRSKEKGRYYNEITFTNIGYFHPDPAVVNMTFRSLSGREFMDAVLAHERFNKTAWTDLEKQPDPNRTILAFLDFDTCRLLHWPNFGGDFFTNADHKFGDPYPGMDFCLLVDKALQSPAMSAPDSRLVVVSCLGDGQGKGSRNACLHRDRNMTKYGKLVVGHMSSAWDQVHPFDFGIPSWPVKTVHLPQDKIDDLENCKPRPFDLVFKGRPRLQIPEFQVAFGPPRRYPKNRIHFGFDHYVESPMDNNRNGKVIAPAPKDNHTSELYYAWMMNSTFCPAPRGDNLYSHRFGEVMSAACIPIFYADGWVLPYNKEVIANWSDIAIVLPQASANKTQEVIDAIPADQRCRMQKRVLEFFNNYCKDSTGRMRGILEIMDARLDHGPVEFTHVPGNDTRRFTRG